MIGLGAKADGVVREDHFVITVASEIMAILCLATDMDDLKERLGRIVVAYNFAGEPVTAKDLHAVGSMAALLKDALKPNLIQTLEHSGSPGPRRPLRQHRPRLQQRHGHQRRPGSFLTSHRHGGRLRCRPGERRNSLISRAEDQG